MSQRPTSNKLLAVAAAAAFAVAGAGCGGRSSEAAAPAGAEQGYPLEEMCVYDPNDGREICGQEGADWCKTYVAERDKVRADENDVDATEIGCEAYEG